MHIHRKTKVLIAGLLILFILMSYYVSTLQFGGAPHKVVDEKLKEIEEKAENYHRLLTSAFASSDFSITQGMDLFENKEYLFSGQFWNDGALTETFTQGWMETMISGFDDVFEDPLTMDSNYDQETVDTDNITYSNGSLGKDGDMTSQDSNEAWFNSSEAYHYPATYSFTDDVEGSNPNGWTISEPAPLEVSVINSFQNHRKVLLLNDLDTVSACYTYNNFVSGISGVIEWWSATNTTGSRGIHYLYNQVPSTIVNIRFYSNSYIQATDLGVSTDLQTYSINTWYHFRMVFNCTTDTYDLYINDVLKADNFDFTIGANYLSCFRLETYASQKSKLYIDAVGYSWDSNYAVGDNMFWQNYMGTETFEQYNQSTNADYRGTYNFDYETEQGYYYMGQNDFNDQEVGDTGLDINWLTSYSGAGGDAKISSELNGHKNILNITDISDPNSVSVGHSFAALRSNVVIEFWLAKKSIASSTSIWFYLWQSGSPKIEVRWQENDFQYNNGTTWLDVEMNFIIANTFNHFKFVCDDTNDLFDVYINNTLEGDNLKYKNTATGMDSCSFNTGSTFSGYSNYIDAIGCPTDDTSYITGYNIPSYDIRPFLDDGYSLTCYLNSYFRSNPSILGHTNILEIRHRNTGSQITQKSFTGQNAGTIELWWAISDATRQSDIQLIGNSGTRVALVLSIQSDKLRYYLGGWMDVPSMPISDNVWYHIRIEFDGTSDTWDLYVDGTNKLTDIAYRTDTGVVGNIDLFKISCYATSVYDYSAYFNAIHFSWTPGYVQYSNTNPYHEDLVNTNFDDEWTPEYSPYTTVYINGFYNNHKKHLNLTDSNAYTRAGAYYVFPDTISGWIEMWVMSPPTGKNATICIEYSTGEYGALVRFDIDNTIDVYDGVWVNLMSISPSTWYQIKIYFNCTTDTYDLYVNEVLKRANNNFLFTRTYLNRLTIRTSNTLANYSVLVDSIDFGWEDTMGLISNLTVVPTLNFTIDLQFDELYADIIQLLIYRYQYTPISTPISMYLYNYTTGLFHNVSRVVSTVGTLFTYTDSIYCANVVNSTGNMRIRIYAFNNDYEFYLRVDRFQVKFWEKTLFYTNKTFYEVNTWKYRFHILSATLGDKYTDWVFFDVIDREPNFKAVSESKFRTEWILSSIEQTVSSEIVYDEDFKINTWSIIGGVSTTFTLEDLIVEDDSFVKSDSPDGNFGSDVYLWSVASSGSLDYWSYIRCVEPVGCGYIYEKTSGATIYYYIYDYDYYSGTVFYRYRTYGFDEDTITWNNKPAQTGYYGSETISIGWHSVYATNDNTNFALRLQAPYPITSENDFWVYSSESGTKPYMDLVIDKYYQNKTYGYIWYQTTTSELIGVLSPVFSDKFLHTGSTILLDLETDQDDAQIRLMNDGVEVKSIQALQYNTIYTEQEVEIYIDEDITFDQVKVVSNLQNKQYVKLYSIRCNDIEYEDEELTTDLHIQAYGSEQILLPDGITSLKIYENDILRINKTITLSFDLYTEVFEAPYSILVNLGLYDYDNEFLNFERFTVYINYTYNNQDFTDIRLFASQLFVDEGTTIEFIIYDSFNVAVYNQSRITQAFIDIYLQVYSLKIKNDDYRRVDFELQKLPITKTGILAPNELIEYSIYSGTYNFSYTKEGWDYYEDLIIDFSDDNLLIINSSQLCYLSYANQKAEYLFFSNYKTYLNSTLIYFNTFYGEVSEHIGIEIKDRYGISILNQTYIVQSEENYIAITLIEYSLKVYNQQPYFNHINITRDPNYYETSQYWSEWLAPGEISDFHLFGGYYRINFTRAETADWYAYAYTLNGDDILVITSSNTIYNVLQNIQNVNTTIGNQITNVWIDITNQNSDINNTIINIDIALTNVNSTLGTMLLYQNISLTNIESDIGTLFTYIGSEFVILGSNVNTSFIDLESTVYLVNNSIYTAVNSLESNLLIINNSISGNISFMLAQNVFLTEMFQKTMFSHLLNWSNVAYNVSFLEEQIMLKKFINNYKDKTLELQLRYQNVTETLRITAQNAKEQYLPINNVSMRVYSVDDVAYLSEWSDWTDLSAEDEEVIDFGFYEELEVPIRAEVVDARLVDYVLAFILLGIIIIALAGSVYYYYQRSEKQKRKVEIMNEYPNNQFNPQQISGIRKKLRI